MISVTSQLKKIERQINSELEKLSQARTADKAAKMTEEEYKKNWADWQRLVNIRNNIISNAIFETERLEATT